MALENYLQHLHHETNLCEPTIRLIHFSLKRFHSFLNSESVVDLGAIDHCLLYRYAGTFSNMQPSSLRRHLFIICRYLDYVASNQQKRSKLPKSAATPTSHGPSSSLSDRDSSASSTIAIPGDSMHSHFRWFSPSMSQFYESTVYIPSFGDIRRLIELASSHERTQPVGELAYIVASTGIRIGELVNLRVTDIVADMYLVRIASKSSPTDRYVPLSPRALQSLASLHMRFPESELVLGDKSHSYLHTLVHRLHVLACNMGAQSMRLHSLRRAMLQHLHSLGKTLREEAAINDVAGHANLAVKSSGSASDVETNLEIAKRLLKDLWAMLDLNEA